MKAEDAMHNSIKILGGGLLALALAACSDRTVNDMRMERFSQPDVAPITVKPSALAVNLEAAADGRGLNGASLKALNDMLNQQGRLAQQTLIVTPYTPRGEQLAARLVSALRNAGADGRKLSVRPRVAASGQGDLQVVSQALAVQTSRCRINDPDMLMVKPFEAVGYLGCANQSNLAMMAAAPRDLIQARSLDDADGVTAVNSIERYQQDNVKDLIDVDFSQDD